MSIFPTKILLATDGSQEAELASSLAADLAKGAGSELHIVYVGHLPLVFYESPGAWVLDPDLQSRMEEAAEKEARAKLAEQVRQVQQIGGEVAGAHVRLGRPEVEIVGLAEELGARLIVLGSRGLGGIRRALIGSVSDSVVRHAHCPVLVVRAGGNGQQVAPFSRRILLATDGSEEATLATQAATEMAAKTGSELHLVYVRVPPYHPSYEGIHTEDYLHEEEEELEREAQELLNEQVRKIEAAGGTVAQVHPRVGRPESEITDLAEEIGAGLVVMGSRGLGAMRRVLMGSVSGSVIRHAHCSVLVVREDKPVEQVEEAGPEAVGLV